MASESQTNVNRENAHKSNGPTSTDGFERCKASSVTHGLTAKLGRLITDSEEAYEKSIKNTFLRLQPANESEAAIVQYIAENEWKLTRASLFEQSVVAKGIWDNRQEGISGAIAPTIKLTSKTPKKYMPGTLAKVFLGFPPKQLHDSSG